MTSHVNFIIFNRGFKLNLNSLWFYICCLFLEQTICVISNLLFISTFRILIKAIICNLDIEKSIQIKSHEIGSDQIRFL